MDGVWRKRFSDTINNSILPCNNFYEHVCNTWNKLDSQGRSKYIHRVDVRRLLHGLLENSTIKKVDDIQAADMVKIAYTSCLKNEGNYRKEAEVIKHLLKGHGIMSWALQPGTSRVNYLSVLNSTGLYPFLNVEVKRTKSSWSRNTLVVSAASPHVLPWTDWQGHRISKRKRDKIKTAYKQLIINVISLVHPNRPNKTQVAASIMNFEERLAKLDEMWFKRIAGFWTEPTLELYKMQNYLSGKFPLFLLLSNQFKRVNVTLRSNQKVTVQNRYHVNAILDCIQKTDSNLLQNYMGWMLILDYIKTAGGKLQQHWQTFKNEAKFSLEEQKEWKELCLDALVTEETTMYAPAANLYLERYFPPIEKERAFVMISHIVEALVNLIEKNEWMDQKAMNKALDRLREVKYRIGYDDFFVNMTYLNTLYTFVDRVNITPQTPFITIHSMLRRNLELKRMQSLQTNEEEFDYRFGPFFTQGYYDSTSKTLIYQAASLHGIFSEEHLPKSYLYGGLGSKIAYQIARTVETMDISTTNSGVPGNVYVWSGIMAKNYLEAAKCLQRANRKAKDERTPRITFASYVASRLARQAYVEAVKDENVDYALPGDQFNSSEKLFYYSYGQLFCRGAGYSYTVTESEERVNFLMKLDPVFLDLFSCPKYAHKLEAPGDDCVIIPEKPKKKRKPKKDTSVKLAAIGAVVQQLLENNLTALLDSDIEVLDIIKV
ncbi:membrane metallo-endopeptidase-like 1 [Ixodes scapularis]|uniref:membrane metallo-endopeptidase-like 1 n=1 Tax=Ixodes scapularis TaxID=6945 RepID=UPI001C37E87A|nr:membrane metallo-endopeptidase-like 1 [Ixodes scapularis]